MSLYKHIPIDAALKEHTALISKLRETCKDQIAKDEQQFNDDLFLLRFCLSHKGDYEKTKAALLDTIEWRYENRELLAKLADGTWLHPDEQKLRKYAPSDLHKCAKDGSPIFIVRGGISQPSKIVADLGKETIVNGVVFSKERIYQICHRESKRSNFIVKMIAINDGWGGSVLRDFSMSFALAMGSASHQMTDRYPQLLGMACIVNPPSSAIQVLMSLAKKVMPASMMEKACVCMNKKQSHEGSIFDCPASAAAFDRDSLPSFLGGNCQDCSGCCVGGVSNDKRDKVIANLEDVNSQVQMEKKVAVVAATPTSAAASVDTSKAGWDEDIDLDEVDENKIQEEIQNMIGSL